MYCKKIHFSDLNTLPDHMVVGDLHLKNLMHPNAHLHGFVNIYKLPVSNTFKDMQSKI